MMDIVELDEVTLGSMVSACATFVLQSERRQANSCTGFWN